MTPIEREQMLAGLSSEEKAALDAHSAIQVPLSEYLLLVAERIGAGLLKEHAATCIVHQVKADVETIKVRFATLVGLMVGSGLLGGGTVAIAAKWL